MLPNIPADGKIVLVMTLFTIGAALAWHYVPAFRKALGAAA